MFTTAWLKDAAERAVATFAEVLVPVFATGDLFGLDYKAALGLGGAAAITSVLKSVVATRVGDGDSAALTK